MTTTPAGWYPAPEGPFERWWDGQQWTEHSRPLQQQAAPAPTPHVAVTKSRKSTSHTFHLIMTIITLGAWGLFVWLPITLWHKMGPRAKEVTHYR